MGKASASGCGGANGIGGSPRDERPIGLHRGKTACGRPDIDKASPCWPVGSPIVTVAPHGDAAIVFKGCVGAVAGKDLGVSVAGRGADAAARSQSPGGDAAIGLERRVGVGIGNNAGVAGTRGGIALGGRVAPDGNAAICLLRGETKGGGINLRETSGQGRTTTPLVGIAPGRDGSVGLNGGKCLIG